MSKTKMTIEELLEEALVPEEEQSYELPDNWMWVKTETVNEIVTGSTPPKKNENYYGGDFPFIKPADLEQGNQVTNASEYLTKEGKMVSRIIPRDSTLVCCIGSIGKVGFSRVESTTNQQINSLIPNKCILNPKFNYYQVLNSDYQNQLWKRSSATTVSIINKSKMSEIPMVLPPLNEQKRIAEKVERLLNKIEEAKELIEEAKQTFELRRAAILDKAFRGDMTREWREENPDVTFPPSFHFGKEFDNISFPHSWKLTNCESIAAGEKHSLAIGPFGSDLKVTDYTEQGVPLIFVRNIRSSNYGLEPKFVSEEKANQLHAHIVRAGDVLITKMGDPPGDADICPDSIRKAVITADCIKLRVNSEIINNKFVLYAIRAPFVQEQIRSQSKGVAQQKITLQIFKDLQIPIPPLLEQSMIVRQLDRYMELEMKSVMKIESILAGTVLLKQSILSKAFRGELGTNDPREENAIELLKGMLQEQMK